MERFSSLMALCEGKSSVTPLTKASDAALFYLICAWTNGWVNDRDTGDLRPHRTHYDANVAW